MTKRLPRWGRGGPATLRVVGLLILVGFVGFGLLYAFVSLVLPFITGW